MRLTRRLSHLHPPFVPAVIAGLAVLAVPALAGPMPPRARPRAASPTRRGPAARRAPEGVLLWPLQVPGSVLSAFGEYRYDHLHAGIDISTGGSTGYKVLAADAGEVFRLKVEWRGYGRALYLRHRSGRVTVYGHLERYEDAVLHLERLVARRQAEAKTRYPGDIYPDPPIRVRRGQVIAFSGESGVGPPHLHFEVRDRQDAPVDPFEAGLLPRDDRLPPVLETLIVTAASPGTFVEGEAREKSYPLKAASDGRRTTDGPVRVNGPFLVALSAYDPAGESGRAGVHAIETAVDGTLRYRLAFRSFRFEQYPESGLIYDHRYSRLGPAAFAYRLFHLPGNELGSGNDGGSAVPVDDYPGAFDLGPGPHVLDISVEDSAGNRSRGRVCILVGRPGEPEDLRWDDQAGGHGSIRFRYPGRDPAPPLAANVRSRGCQVPQNRVEAEFWDESGGGFRPMICDLDRGVCAPPQGAASRGVRAARIREIRDGVTGPWRILTADPPGSSTLTDLAPALEAWPAFLDVLATMTGPNAPPLRLAAGNPRTILEPLVYRNALRWGAALPYARASGSAPFFLVVEGEPSPIASLVLDARWVEPGHPLDYEGPGFALRLPAGSRFFAGPVALRTERIAGTDRLPAMAEAIELLPDGEALNERGTLSFEVNPDAVAAETLGIYRWDAGRGHWSYEGGELDSGRTRLSLAFRRYGRFALLQDASPPGILEIKPRPGSRGVARRPEVQARIEEEGKGLNYDGVVFEIDGRSLESEFDPDRGLSKVLEPPRLSPGTHHLRVVATDLAGNASQPVEGDFEVR